MRELTTTGVRSSSGQMVSGTAEVATLGFVSSNAAGNVIFYDGVGQTNEIKRWELSGIDKAYAGQTFNPPLRFTKGVYAAITGGGTAYIAIINSQANQLQAQSV
jgi:hypothetical protein